jgi:hypothetical protein
VGVGSSRWRCVEFVVRRTWMMPDSVSVVEVPLRKPLRLKWRSNLRRVVSRQLLLLHRSQLFLQSMLQDRLRGKGHATIILSCLPCTSAQGAAGRSVLDARNHMVCSHSAPNASMDLPPKSVMGLTSIQLDISKNKAARYSNV